MDSTAALPMYRGSAWFEGEEESGASLGWLVVGVNVTFRPLPEAELCALSTLRSRGLRPAIAERIVSSGGGLIMSGESIASSSSAGFGSTSLRASSKVLGTIIVPPPLALSPARFCSRRRPKRNLKLLSRVLPIVLMP